jgi:hypothetical protein
LNPGNTERLHFFQAIWDYMYARVSHSVASIIR